MYNNSQSEHHSKCAWYFSECCQLLRWEQNVRLLMLNFFSGLLSVAGAHVTSRKYLFVGEALLSEDLEQWSCIAVSSLEHLPDNGQKVPNAFWLSSPQRTQQTRPLSSSWRLRGRQIHGVYITVNTIHRIKREIKQCSLCRSKWRKSVRVFL